MGKLKVIIGRDPQSCDYQIENAGQHGTVSGRHATLSTTDNPDCFLFEDHSRNGSYINGQRIHNESREIRINDHITLGRTYQLPLEEIVRRYLLSSRTTKRKPINQTPIDQPIDQTPIGDPYDSSKNISINNSSPSSIDNGMPRPVDDNIVNMPSNAPSSPKPEIPIWFWIMIIGAFVLGCIIGVLL